MNKLMVSLFIAITIVFAVLVTKTMADEIVPEKKPIEMKIKGWVVNEWNDIKEYQANNWQEGKEQLARNKEQILNLFSKIAKN
jgi:hypothetical protein